ncbi:hypothetical protein [Leifsonia sp. NPDC058248]|uniref:hypothetical protein n=1 Tax=Leifsonia sp. NPDC058248 TaxID=3346402 RepID=UPI0036DECE35
MGRGQATTLAHASNGFGAAVCVVLASCGLIVVLVNVLPDELSALRHRALAAADA